VSPTKRERVAPLEVHGPRSPPSLWLNTCPACADMLRHTDEEGSQAPARRSFCVSTSLPSKLPCQGGLPAPGCCYCLRRPAQDTATQPLGDSCARPALALVGLCVFRSRGGLSSSWNAGSGHSPSYCCGNRSSPEESPASVEASCLCFHASPVPLLLATCGLLLLDLCLPSLW
jgi:hypothetical protein